LVYLQHGGLKTRAYTTEFESPNFAGIQFPRAKSNPRHGDAA